MHTDEYEISLGREITLCRNRVKKLKKSLEKLEKQCGMTTAAFLQAQEEGGLAAGLPIRDWNREYRELQYWQKTLMEYENALAGFKGR